MNNQLALFEEKEIRKIWKDNKWYFSVEDVVFALTNSVNTKDYINKMRRRDEALNKGYGQFVHTLKMDTKGGKQN